MKKQNLLLSLGSAALLATAVGCSSSSEKADEPVTEAGEANAEAMSKDAGDGSCGAKDGADGSCGAKDAADGSCGAKDGADGSCGADAKKAKEAADGSCGSGSCGGKL